MLNNFKNDELVKVQGKIYPVVGGRLRMAHDENKLLSIETSVLYYNDDSTVVHAHVKTEKGTFAGLGNASAKRDRKLANAILELAETRAIARALRFAGYGVEYTGFEEMPDTRNASSEDENKEGSRDGNREVNKDEIKDIRELNPPDPGATKAQLNAIFSLAQSINMTNDELRKTMQDMTGKSYSKDLSKRDASEIINELKQKESNNKAEAH
ncbi:MAG: hypothetical protein K0Q99_2012 [Clostridia bacterium]|jgi:hypothetical protein|nr:hypothetical protein [Clostridia bacterium]